jgi:hypothetical protein
LFGSAAAVRYDGREFGPTTAKGAYFWSYRLSNTGAKFADFSCNPDYNVFQVGVVTRWTPVKNLTFSTEAMYFRLDQNFTGTAMLAMRSPKPVTVPRFPIPRSRTM